MKNVFKWEEENARLALKAYETWKRDKDRIEEPR